MFASGSISTSTFYSALSESPLIIPDFTSRSTTPITASLQREFAQGFGKFSVQWERCCKAFTHLETIVNELQDHHAHIPGSNGPILRKAKNSIQRLKLSYSSLDLSVRRIVQAYPQELVNELDELTHETIMEQASSGRAQRKYVRDM